MMNVLIIEWRELEEATNDLVDQWRQGRLMVKNRIGQSALTYWKGKSNELFLTIINDSGDITLFEQMESLDLFEPLFKVGDAKSLKRDDVHKLTAEIAKKAYEYGCEEVRMKMI